MKIFKPKGRMYNGIYLPPLAGGVDMFNLDQSHFRFRNDDGTEITATWKKDEDVSETITVDTTFRIRLVLQELEGVADTEDMTLQRNLASGGWVTVSDISAVIKTVDSSDAGVNDGDATTNIIGGTGTFAAGEIVSSETSGDADTNSATSFAASGHSEYEFIIQVVGADVTDAQTIELRVVNQMGSTFDAYTKIPVITVDKPSGGGGGFPQVADITTSEFDTSTTAHLVSMPATVAANDLLIVFFSNDGTTTVTTPTGWTQLDSQADSSNIRFSIYYKDAVGNEDGTTVDFVTAADQQAAAQVYRITSTSWHGTTVPAISTVVTGNDVNPDPADLNPSGWGTENTLWIASYGADDQEDATGYPTNYTDGTYNESFAGSGSSGVGTARRELAAASENPGTFTINATQQWVAFTVAIRPSESAVTRRVFITSS